MGDVAEQVGVEEDDEVAGGRGQRLPQRLALARAGAVRGQHVGGGDDVGAGRRATAAVSSVESESMTSSSSTSGTRRIQRSCRSATRRPTVAASSRAGRTTLTRWPPRRLARSRAGRSTSAREAADVVRCSNQARASGLIATLSTRIGELARTAHPRCGRVHAFVTAREAFRRPPRSLRIPCGSRAVRRAVGRARVGLAPRGKNTGKAHGGSPPRTEEMT